MTSREAIAWGDEALIAQLGYKHEFKRAFNPLEVHLLRLSSQSTPARGTLVGVRVSFSIIGLLPSIAYVSSILPSNYNKQTCTALFLSMPCRMVACLLWCGGYVLHRGTFWRVEMLK